MTTRAARLTVCAIAAVLAAACSGDDGGAATTPSTFPAAPCESAETLARDVLESTGYAVAATTVDTCTGGYALVAVEPDSAFCAAAGIDCPPTWVFAQDSGELDWFHLASQPDAVDCAASEEVTAACEALGVE